MSNPIIDAIESLAAAQDRHIRETYGDVLAFGHRLRMERLDALREVSKQSRERAEEPKLRPDNQ